jgi:hypothetical protein
VQAGVDGASRIIIEGHLKPGVYRQEYYPPGGALQALVLPAHPDRGRALRDHERSLATVSGVGRAAAREEAVRGGVGEIQSRSRAEVTSASSCRRTH